MKLILMMVREDKVEPVRKALSQLNIRDVAVCQVEDFSPQRRPQGVWRGRVYTLDCTVKMEIQCVVHDDEADLAVRAVLCAARTGCAGDGHVVVVPIEHRYNIHNGERDVS
jgi:nitrogen regulatory protein P-II 1